MLLMKFMIMVLVFLTMTVIACSNNQGNDVQEFEARLASDLVSISGLHTIFVSDNIAGERFTYLNHDIERNFDDYEVEAYRLHLTEETIVVDAETGNHIDHDLEPFYPFEYPNQRLTVELNAEFERSSIKPDAHISEAPIFLPVIEAQKITIHQFTKKEYTEFHQPVSDESFIYMIYEDDRSFSNFFNPQFAHELFEQTGIDLEVRLSSIDSHEAEYLDIEHSPTHIILSNEGEILRTSSEEEAIIFIEELIGMPLPTEGEQTDDWDFD